MSTPTGRFGADDPEMHGFTLGRGRIIVDWESISFEEIELRALATEAMLVAVIDLDPPANLMAEMLADRCFAKVAASAVERQQPSYLQHDPTKRVTRRRPR